MMILLGFLAYLAQDAFYAGSEEVGEKINGNAKKFVQDILKASGMPPDAMMYVLWEQELSTSYEYSTTWMGSNKTIKLFRKYKCLYGVDASLEGVNASWESPGVLKMNYPKVALITMEPVGDIKIETDGGVWNHIQAENHEAVHNGLLQTALSIAAHDTNALMNTKMRFQELIRQGMNGDLTLKMLD